MGTMGRQVVGILFVAVLVSPVFFAWAPSASAAGPAPTGTLSATPSDPIVAERVRVASNVTDPNGDIAEWAYDFDDGETYLARPTDSHAFNAASENGALPSGLIRRVGNWTQLPADAGGILEGVGSYAKVEVAKTMPHDKSWTARVRVLHTPESSTRTFYLSANHTNGVGNSHVFLTIRSDGLLSVGYRDPSAAKEITKTVATPTDPRAWNSYQLTIVGDTATATVNGNHSVSIAHAIVASSNGPLSVRIYSTLANARILLDDLYAFDGNVSPTPPPHAYSTPGTYRIKLTAKDQDSNSIQLVKQVVVTDPRVVFEGPLEPRAGIAGADMTHRVKLTHRGVVTDNYTLSVTSSGKGIAGVVEPNKVMLYPGEMRWVNVTTTVPSGASVGDVLVFSVTAKSVGKNLVSSETFSLRVVSAPAGSPAFLFVNPAELAAAKTTASTTSWGASAKGRLALTASTTLLRNLSVLPTPGQWFSYYVCADGTPLLFEYNQPYRHKCPSTGQTIVGNYTIDAAWAALYHNELGEDAWQSALYYAIWGNETYANVSINLLTQFSNNYLNLPIHDKDNTSGQSGARVFAGTLEEAYWLVRIAGSYDLVRAKMTPAQRANVEQNLLVPAIETIKRNDAGLSNRQVWHNAAILSVGYLTGRNDYKTLALDGPSGLRYQLANGIQPDGMWWEGSSSYHLYVADALTWAAIAANHSGVDLFHETPNGRGIELMLRSAAEIANQAYIVPALNDGYAADLSKSADLYEIANRQFTTPIFDGVLAYAYGPGAQARKSEWALLFGSPYSAVADARTSRVFAESGVAVLRTPKSYSLIDYGPHGGTHGHDDKLNIVYSGPGYSTNDSFALRNLGSPSYAIPAYEGYFKRSLAHNTMLVDGKTQTATTGALLDFQTQGGATLARAEVTGAYDTATLTRTLVQTDEYLLDVSDAESKDASSHTFDFVFHGNLPLTAAPSTTPGSLSGDASYAYLSNVGITRVDAPFEIEWRKVVTADDTFDSLSQWTGLKPSTTTVKEGTGAGKWANTTTITTIRKVGPANWGAFEAVEVWAHSVAATYNADGTGTITVVAGSDNLSTEGPDYYYAKFKVDWTGWKLLHIARSEFSVMKNPIGWNRITEFYMASNLLGSKASASTVLTFDDLRLVSTDPNYRSPRDVDALDADIAPGASGTLALAQAPNSPMVGTHPVAVLRQTGQNARVVSVLDANDGTQRTQCFAVSGNVISVRLANDWVDTIDLGAFTFTRSEIAVPPC